MEYSCNWSKSYDWPHLASVLFHKTDEIPNNKLQIPNQKIKFPALALLISGGHTELIYLKID